MTDATSLSQTEQALVRATGGAILMIATLLQREGLLSMEELGGKLGIYGVISAETSREEGLILAAWSGMLSSMAGDLPKFHKH
ncbi:hypothetical protein [Novosphingobium guangzhouense]|uniref:hypothetical protein n=1 Tax=Novosphingobium guangzhouense TaxID=1850347 RepID=UPI000CCC9D3A|nr:hypothetical protein [Novosphingobium guangzhouense]